MPIILDLTNHQPIPKVIHCSWKNKDILSNPSPLITKGIANMQKINPDYKLEISDDQDVEEYIIERLSKWDYFKIRNKKIVEKVDLWRLLKMYEEGGVYVDIDRFCNISFDEIIKEGTKCILPTHRDADFSQDIMISCKENPIFLKAIELNLKKRKLISTRSVFQLGPPIYMRAVTETVFGDPRERKPGKEKMDEFRNLLDQSKDFQTYYEDLPNDSIIYSAEKDNQSEQYLDSKKDLYDSENIVPWNRGYESNVKIAFFLVIGLLIIALLYFFLT